MSEEVETSGEAPPPLNDVLPRTVKFHTVFLFRDPPSLSFWIHPWAESWSKQGPIVAGVQLLFRVVSTFLGGYWYIHVYTMAAVSSPLLSVRQSYSSSPQLCLL